MARPRLHPVGTTAAQRVKLSIERLVAQGGARKSIRLKPETNKTLADLKTQLGVRTETEVIEQAILQLARARQATGAQA